MTTTLERLTGLRLTQVLVAATVAALFLVATAGVASAAGSSYPTPEPPTRTHTPAQPAPPPRVVGKPTVLPVTGGDAIGLAVLGVGAAGVGAGLVVWSRRRSTAPAAT